MSFLTANQGLPVSIKSICLYCGSSDGIGDLYRNIAREVSTALAKRKFDIVYGGGHVGLMGVVADAALQAGARVIGIIPDHIRKMEVQHTGLSELHVVPDMHTRKRMMVERSDVFVILPGGLGTLDEAFEIITWKKLKLHNKPILIFNYKNYWDPLIALIEHTVGEGFANKTDLKLFTAVATVDEMFTVLASSSSSSVTKTELT